MESTLLILIVCLIVAACAATTCLALFPPRVEHVTLTGPRGKDGPTGAPNFQPGIQGIVGPPPGTMFPALTTETVNVTIGTTVIGTGTMSIGYGPNGLGINPLFVWFSGSASWPDITPGVNGPFQITTSLIRTTSTIWPFMAKMAMQPSLPGFRRQLTGVSDPFYPALQFYINDSFRGNSAPLGSFELSAGGTLLANRIVFQGFFPTT